MWALAALFGVAATVLLVGGALKAVRADDTVGALQSLGLTVSPAIVRIGGLGEAAVGAAALVVGGRLSSALMAVSYVVLAGFVVLALVRDTPLSSCGCLGRIDTPPTITHVVVNVVAAVVAVVVALVPDAAPVEVIDDQPLFGVPFALAVAAGVGAVFLLLTALPRRSSSSRPRQAPR